LESAIAIMTRKECPMSKLFRQVYLDHVINQNTPEMAVSDVGWRPLPGSRMGVAMITLKPATAFSLRESGDEHAFAQAGRQATIQESQSAFSVDYDGP
jgi:hypothetical protein